MRRYGLRDDQWKRIIKNHLPDHENHIGGTAADNRLFVEAALYRYRAGIHVVLFLSGSVTGKTYTGVCAADAKMVSSKGSFVIWSRIMTRNT